jgi:hypothetical protein
MQPTSIRSFLLLIILFISGCGGTHNPKSITPPIPYHVWITLKNDKPVVDRIMAMCNLAQKPNKIQVSYPASTPGSIMIEYYWKRISPELIEKLKKACSKEPALISLENE